MGSYRRSAKVARAVLLPAGDAWHAAWSCRGSLPLYGPDGFHPSRLGTYVAAVVVWARLFHDSPVACCGRPAPLRRAVQDRAGDGTARPGSGGDRARREAPLLLNDRGPRRPGGLV